MNDGMCDGCGIRIPSGKEMYFVHTDYGEQCFCEKCAKDLLIEEVSDAELLDAFYEHRTVGCHG
jgi:hypothetical protein